MEAPDGYILVEDIENHVLKSSDFVVTMCCGTMKPSWVRKYSGCTTEYIHSASGCDLKEIYTKGIMAPRFPTNKPYPYGY